MWNLMIHECISVLSWQVLNVTIYGVQQMYLRGFKSRNLLALGSREILIKRTIKLWLNACAYKSIAHFLH